MLRLMTYNILEGGGPPRRQRLLLEVLERLSPDLLVVNEAVDWHPRHPAADRIAAALGYSYRVARSASGFDVAIFSRCPIVEFHQPEIPQLFHSAARLTVETPSGRRLHVVGTHLDYREEALRVKEVEALLPHVAPLLETDAAILGDLNAIAPDDSVMGLAAQALSEVDLQTAPDWFAKRYPPQALARLLEAGWCDAFRLRHGLRSGYTMSTSDPNARYDYVLVSPSLAGRVRDVIVETAPPASNASDHFPVVADIDV
ncbi:MAG: endonuclease/exonuclease/phosphatase family protein [Planctomycetes bacterium]|nr:endonuclease/exonuclease/phosphatase family protein [Planctomycetota bacterium]